MHVLQGIPDMIAYQNFNRAPGIDTWMTGTLWHPAMNCGHNKEIFPRCCASYGLLTGIPDDLDLEFFLGDFVGLLCVLVLVSSKF